MRYLEKHAGEIRIISKTSQVSYSNAIKTLQSAFSAPVSWIKASSSCQYRFEILGVVGIRSENRITAHAHRYYEVGLGLAGTAELVLGRERHELCPGALYIVEPGVTHRLSCLAKESFSAFIFLVTPETLLDSLPGIHSSKVFKNKDLLEILLSWAEINQARLIDPVALSLFARFMAFEMLSLLSHGDSEVSWTLVERAKSYIENKLPGRIDVPAMAAFLKVSERTLRRHFQGDLNKSVIQYVNERRLAVAERYLALHLSVADIAHLIGFESASQLTRLFQKSKGVSPKAWQQSVAPTRRILASKSLN